MNKQIAVGIAAGVLSISGVASAAFTVHQSANVSPESQEASVAAHAETPFDLPGLPGVPDVGLPVDGLLEDVSQVTGIAEEAIAHATNIADDPEGSVTGAIGALPTACQVALPVSAPLPAGTLAQGIAVAGTAEALAHQQLGAVPALPLDVPQLPVDAPNAFGFLSMVKAHINCLASHHSGASPIPSVCGVHAGIPAAVPVEPVAGLIASIGNDIAGMTGQGVSVNGGNGHGVNCTADPDLATLPGVPALPGVPGLPQLPAVPTLPVVDVPAVPTPAEITGTVTDAVSGATGTVGGVIDTATSVVPSLPVLSTPDCQVSGSANASGGLLSGIIGNLSASLTGSC